MYKQYLIQIIFMSLDQTQDPFSDWNDHAVVSPPFLNEEQDVNSLNCYEKVSNETLNGCPESLEEFEPEQNDNLTTHPKINLKPNVLFLENGLAGLKTLKNLNGTKIIDTSSIKNSRSLPLIADIL